MLAQAEAEPLMAGSVRRIALTGGIASGKSLAAEYLKDHGVPVIDADEIVHRLLQEDTGLKAQIRDVFGNGVFCPNGNVDRQKLGLAVFADAGLRKQLESWIHPKVREAIEVFYGQHAHEKQAVSVIPLLFESGLEDRYDEVWLIESDESDQLQRLIEKRGMSQEDALARIQSQMTLAEKRERTAQHACGQIIPNASFPENLYEQLDKLL